MCSNGTTRPQELKSSMTMSRWHLKVTLGDGVFLGVVIVSWIFRVVWKAIKAVSFLYEIFPIIQACTMPILS